MEVYKNLKARKQVLERQLKEKYEQLKVICIEEAVSDEAYEKRQFLRQEITGQMPKEVFLSLRPGELPPKYKKRIGTAFPVDFDVVPGHRKMSTIERLQGEIEVRNFEIVTSCCNN